MQLANAASGEPSSGDPPMRVIEIAELYRDVLTYCCIEPRISVHPQTAEEIHPREIPQEDWTFIVHWALRVEEARALEGFRGGRTDDGDRGDGESIRTASIVADGDRRPGFGVEL